MKSSLAVLCVFLLAFAAAGQTVRVSPNVMAGPATSEQSSQPASQQKPGATQQPGDQKGTGSIEGAVLTQDGDRPVRKATVTLNPIPTAPNPNQMIDNRQQFQTEADGHFVFKDLPAGQYSLMVQHPNYVGTGRQARMVNQMVRLSDGQAVKDLTFRLVPAGIIRGRVTDEDGDPVARAQISVMRQQYFRGKKQFMNAGGGNTDDLGEFRVSSLPPGTYWVSASRQQMMGMPGGPEAKQTRQYVRTFYPGATDVQSASPVDVKPGDEVPVNISLMKMETAEVKGTVTQQTGEKAENGQVSLAASGDVSVGMGGYSAMLRNGEFDLRVPPGHYRVTAMTFPAPTGQMIVPSYTTSTIDVPPQGLQDLKLQTGSASKVTAHVAVEGATQAVNLDNIRIQLQVHRDDDDPRNFFMMGDMGNAKADKDGNAVIERLNAGTYEVNYFGGLPGYQDAYLKSVLQGNRDVLPTGFRVSGDGQMHVTISVNGGYVEGIVSDADHKPVKGAMVVDVPPEEFRTRDQFYRIGSTDQNGHFLLHSIRPGRHLLLALEDPEQGVWLDPVFLKTVESKGENFSIDEREHKQFQLQVIPKTQTAVGQ